MSYVSLLSAVCCLLSAVCCLLSAVCCLLSAVCCVSAVCCLLCVCCLLSAVCCIYISLQLCKMTDARASHINAQQGTDKAQNTKNYVNTSKLNTKKNSAVAIVTSVAAHIYQPPSSSPPPLSCALVPSSVPVTSFYLSDRAYTVCCVLSTAWVV
jgi:hypothetical protein